MGEADSLFVEARARFVYEVCRFEAIASGRLIIPEPFDERDIEFRKQFVLAIERICAEDASPTTPELEHLLWMKAYETMGWRYGPERDPIAKTHPDMVPYSELPEAERLKDEIFLAVCALARKYIKLF